MTAAPEVVPLNSPVPAPEPPDIICLSHLRWDFVFQRPQHLMTRCARAHRVFFVEEPVPCDKEARLEISPRQGGVQVVVPYIPESCLDQAAVQARLLDELFDAQQIDEYVLWYYTPMATAFTGGLSPIATVYDCMDELSAFAGAPQGLLDRERALMDAADVVFTGGRSLYERKRHLHGNIHAFPSSVDVPHFARARTLSINPPDQAAIPRPRLGFFGVIDERMDLDLVAGVAAARPDWHLVLLGPIAKIDPACLPRAANLHYLGAKSYAELPLYLAGWDVALLPFARNEATKFISPTKTPEYLAAGRPVVSTSIADVVRPYGQSGLARIADSTPDFVAAVESAMAENAAERLQAADAFLSHTSWDGTWNRMHALLLQAVAVKQTAVRSTGTTGVGERT